MHLVFRSVHWTDVVHREGELAKYLNLHEGTTRETIASFQSGVKPNYKHILREKDLTERMFLLTAAYKLEHEEDRLKPDFELHILPLIRDRAPLMGTDTDYDQAVGYSTHELCFTTTDTPNVLVAAYAAGMTPDPVHFMTLPPSQFKAWALAAAYFAGLPPMDEHLQGFAAYELCPGDFIGQACKPLYYFIEAGLEVRHLLHAKKRLYIVWPVTVSL